MNKMNKKGFTLIEMLVVIAIIAVLVSIIIPTVTSATDKAAAAANAANLRSVKAEIVTAYLTNDTTNYTFASNSVTATEAGAAGLKNVTWKDVSAAFLAKFTTISPATGVDATGFTGTYDANGNIKVYYKGYTINDWAAMAGGKVG